jgi:Cu(I)/Ag(I) efflux system membrane fusion protein
MRNFKWMGVLVVGFSVLMACSEGKESKSEDKAQATVQYTCPMHPQVVKNEMSTCPICFMDLVPFEKSEDKALKLDAQRQLLANVRTMVFGEGQSAGGQSVLNGRLVTDPTAANVISARMAGRVEQLFVKELGVSVRKGQALYRLYSEELASLQQEYVMALAQQKAFPEAKVEGQLVASAKQKLQTYGLSAAQLQQLAAGQKQQPTVTVYATASGTVEELTIAQGQYVSEGSVLMRLANYEKLWAAADVYPAEAKQIKVGQSLKVQVAGFENEAQMMKVDFINPVMSGGSQLVQIRGALNNPKMQWQAGLAVQVFLPQNKAATGQYFVPVDAVIMDALGTHVWVKTGAQTFEPRRVGVGAADAQNIEIKSGLSEGDVVVQSGAYLLYSEYQLKRGKHPLKG